MRRDRAGSRVAVVERQLDIIGGMDGLAHAGPRHFQEFGDGRAPRAVGKARGREGRIAREAKAQPRIIIVVGSLKIGCDEIVQFRSEEHTSELQSLMRISYAVFCLKKKK